MKIYNEVVYQIVDNKLIKVSEDSFEYTGEVVLCGGSTGQAFQTFNKFQSKTINSAVQTATEGPGGTVEGMTDTARDWSDKGSHHAFGTDYDGDDSNDDVDYSTAEYTGEEDNTVAELTALRRQENNMRGRLFSNQTVGQNASMLTS